MLDNEEEALRKSVEKPAPFHAGWDAQELVTRDDLKMILDAHLKIAPHPVPKEMVGKLYCISGIAYACDAIMDYLERRAKLFNGHTKPQQEEEKEDGKEERKERFDQRD